ncbi:hypothetical protein [Algoriphagus sp.]|uniref:hypothetical protein n=1 Tax=Algoriphagus sp. TaxID=1872435 RepID=UPI00391DC173
MKKVLFLCYHHPKNYNSQSAALVRRVGQYQQFFENQKWEIDYITIENKASDKIDFSSGRVLQIELENYVKNKFLNKLFTFYVLIFFGDVIGYSFYKSQKEIDNFLRNDYDLVISFFTPRGTIWLGKKVKEKFKLSWWVDVQDSLDEGLSNKNLAIGIKWLKKQLKPADHIIHVSPEWKILDEDRIGKEILVQRHCIPECPRRVNTLDSFFQQDGNNKIKLFYAGNIHFHAMQPELLKVSMEDPKFKYYYAGSIGVFEKLNYLGLRFVQLGHLDEATLASAFQNSDIILVFAWDTADRQVIPSKFYEACAFNKPIMIVGKDSGSFQSLFKEWGHPNVIQETAEQVALTLDNYSKGDLSNLFLTANCTKAISDKAQFSKFLSNLISKSL